MMKPKFVAEESWDNSGDVDVWFMEKTSIGLINKVKDELNLLIPKLPKESKSTYHVEKLINYIFDTNIIKLDRKNKQWDII